MVTAPNGTIVYSRVSGTTFKTSTYFTIFCLDTCPNTLELTITMTDSGSDGWNGNVFGLSQDLIITSTFGGTFTAGSSSGPVYATVAKNLNTQIVLTKLGSKTNEIGFVITASNGTIIY